MNYGYFDDQAKAFIITRPDTPYPWINYLGSNDFFSLISNTSGGYSFYRDALMLPAGNTSILKTATRSGIRDGSRSKRRWISIAVSTVWAIRASPAAKTV